MNTKDINGLKNTIRVVRFGDFEFDLRIRELRRRGYKVKLQGQPLELLVLFLERPGDVITREEMRARLWPEDTFVDFEHSLNSAIKKLRQALRDSAAKPRFIETLARQGYRFITPVEIKPVTPASAPPAGVSPSTRRPLPHLRWLIAISAVLLIAIILFPFASRLPTGVYTSSHVKLLISGKGIVSDPAISPDGDMLAYVEAEGKAPQIWVRRITGGHPVSISRGDEREAEPVFAPDGEHIAFTRYLARSNKPEVCIAPVLGGEVVPIIEGGRDPAWSPDGSRLAFILEQPDGIQALATSESNGANIHVILIADTTYPFLHFPSWSADGRSIAVERSNGGVSGEIWLVPATGGPAQRLETLRPGVFLHHPVFTPGGHGLIYSSNRAGATNLWYRSLKDGAKTQLTTGPGTEEWPTASRDGEVAFLSTGSEDILAISRLDSGVTKTLLTHSPFLWAPSFSPDGREIAFSQVEYDGSWQIWSIPIAGGEARPLTSGPNPQIYARFSPDGQRLIYFTWMPGHCRIWSVLHSGGVPRPLTPEGEDASYGDLSPDGCLLAFTRTEGGATHLCVIPVNGGPERQLTRFPSTLPRWSPDGKWIAFSPDRGFEGGVFIIRRDGNGVRRLTQSGGWPVWLSDGKRIAFRTLRADGTQQVNFVRLSDAAVTPLSGFQFAGSNYPIDFSPDGKLMVYTNTHIFSSEIWLLNPHR